MTFEALQSRIISREAVVAIIGLGYVGLPLALEFAGKGFRVLGFDVDTLKVESINSSRSYIHHISADRVENAVRQGLRATSDFTRLSEADTILVCVPTPLTEHREPDLSFVVATARSISDVLRRGQLVVLESTTYPGTTRDILRPILEEGGL